MTGRAAERILDLINGYQATCVILAACRLRLFETLANGPRSVEALAATVKADKRSLARLIRALAALDLLECAGDEIALTDDGRMLLADGTRDLATLVREQYFDAWGALGETVIAGRPIIRDQLGMTAWEQRRLNPELNEAFNKFASFLQKATLETLYASYDFSAFSCVADIGGGAGQLLAGILERHARCRGVLFDLPHVVHHPDARLQSQDIGARCSVVGGSFFDDVPRGAGLYVLQHVLHDWDDEECLQILKNCRNAMGDGGILLVLEKVMPHPYRAPRHLAMRDMHMMAVLGGQERTLEQYTSMLAAAGFSVGTPLHLPPPCPDILEARPIPGHGSGDPRGLRVLS